MPTNAKCSAPTHRRRLPHNRSQSGVPQGELQGSCCLDMEAFRPVSSDPTRDLESRYGALSCKLSTRIDAVPSEVVEGLVPWCGWDGVQCGQDLNRPHGHRHENATNLGPDLRYERLTQ